MSLQPRLTYDDLSHTIQIFGRFDFSISKEFDNLVQKVSIDQGVGIDFSYCNYIDSAGIGALVRLKVDTDELDSNIRLLNCKDTVLETLKIADFYKLFHLEDSCTCN